MAGDTDKPPEDRTEPGETSKATGTESPLERMPSHGGFANLAEEFDARRASREAAQGNGTTRLDDDAIKEQTDPFAPDRSKTEGHKQPFERTVRDSDADWTEGVDRFEDLPTGETLSEADEDKRSELENFHRQAFENVGTLKKGVEGVARTIDKALGPKPTGQAEVRTSGPVATDTQHSGIDAGSAASALLALGIVGAEATRRVVTKIRERREADDDGER